ncbi:MAG TPA: RNA-binding protein [Candidatus Blautia faecavium]|uniref:RNA-binding protein n=1 Tax=Candidatus Blautia faecavium TaxID=2838487 RepID=A0A9D2RWS8_9FIRM|nr:RNA-binding protein [Candidatus Blautia faecavium]
MEREEFLLKRIRELANISYQRDIVTFSDFLNLNEQNIINSRSASIPGVVMERFGGYESAERQMIAFHPDALAFPWEYPIDCLKAEPIAAKFSQKLTHRDYLGALLNLGVDRSVVGDILIQENTAYIFCLRKMTDFFMDNLSSVRHTNVTVRKLEEKEELPSPKTELVTGTCSSVRLDALIALAFHASRSSMTPLISGGMVFVNGKLITSNGYEPKEGDIISVRKRGRFRYEGVSHQTKKGRISVKLMLYV